jgi:hypothetical protein
LYVANPTRLAASVQVQLETRTRCEARSLEGRPPPLTRVGSTTWSAELEPYDVAAIVLSTGDVQVVDWNVQFDRESLAELGSVVQELRVRVDQLNRFQPIQVIANPDFEQPASAGQIPGWTFGRNPGVLVELDANHPCQGKQSLHMRVEGNKGIGWIRSRSFPVPPTGRISVQAWIRTRDAAQQPALRMSVDGQLAQGEQYYRWVPLGVDVDGRTFQPTGNPEVKAVPPDWINSPFLVYIVDLPTSTTGEVSVGFDMYGPGEAWIDNVQVSDVYFSPPELNDLKKNVYNAALQRADGRYGWELAECQQFLEGYWPRFLLEFVPSPRLTQVPPSTTHPATRDKAAPAPPAEKPPLWSRFPLKSPFKTNDNSK